VYDDPSLGLQSLFSSLTRELNSSRHDSASLLSAYTQILDITLQRAGAFIAASPAEKLVSRAELIMEERFSSPIKLSAISRELNCSSSGLRAHFRSLRGINPREYLQAMRVRHALGLIRSSDLTFETIAGLCGYDSASHLSRQIKRATDQSPGSLRKARIEYK
jgi:AraC-like DNA-binding protein